MMKKSKFNLANNPLFAESRQFSASPSIPYRVIPLKDVLEDPSQPRKDFDPEKLAELQSSIEIYGVLSPILVRALRAEEEMATGKKYQIIAGERRFRASLAAGREDIPAIIDSGDDDDDVRSIAIQLIENIQREQLKPLEKAQAIGVLKDSFNLSIRDIAKRLGISKSQVHRSLEVLELPNDLLKALEDGASESKVLLLAKVEDPEERKALLSASEEIGVREVKSRVNGHVRGSSKAKSGVALEDSRLLDELTRALGLRASIRRRDDQSGDLILSFYRESELKALFQKLVEN